MSILCIGDIHIQPSNIKVIELFIERIEVILHDMKPDIVILMGDILHSHERLHTLCFNYATKIVKLISSICSTYILVGNHDYINNSQFMSENHWMNCYKTYENVFIVDRVIVKNIKNKNIILCPYVPDGRFIEALDTIECWKKADYIFAHQLIDGAKMGAIVVEGVEKWNIDYPILISGHIHDKQRISSNVIYTGSCIQHSFSETSDKTILHIDVDGKLQEIVLNLPKKKTLYKTLDEMIELDLSKFNDSDTQYKIVIDGDTGDFSNVKSLKTFKVLSSLGVKIVFKHKKSEIIEKRFSSKNIDIHKKDTFYDTLKSVIGDDFILMDVLSSVDKNVV